MRVVIADASPICYLVLIDRVDLLRRLFGRVVIPPEVAAELVAEGAPAAVIAWMQGNPEWVDMRNATDSGDVRIAEEIQFLDAGERAAIRLALIEPEVLLLIDEAAGRQAATRLGIPNTGVLGVLVQAAEMGLVDLRNEFENLQRTNFRVGKGLVEKLLAEARWKGVGKGRAEEVGG